MNTLQERLREAASHMTDFPMRMKTDVMREAAERLDALEAEIAALKADAERYRWLREFEVDSYMACGSLAKLDDAIDAARSKT